MTTTNSESQARAQLESILAMVKRLGHAEEMDGKECESEDCRYFAADLQVDFAEYHDSEAAREAIQESALSVEVRTGWFTPGNLDEAPAEYQILLCTGGPAVRIVGELDQHGEPESARLEHQDWGTAWMEARPVDMGFEGEALEAALDAILAYARQFYYGS